MAHALLRGSKIFPGLELYDKPPDYTRYGPTDIWKGEYRGEPVCVKVVRDRRTANIRDVQQVRRPPHSTGAYSVRFIQDLLPRVMEGKSQLSSERAPRH